MNNNEYRDQFKKRIYLYTLHALKELEKLPTKEAVTPIIVKQVVRSLTSIGANFIEAQASSSKKDFTNFISYSLKSANETKFWLGLLRDLGKMDKSVANELLTETTEIASMLGSTVLKLKGKK